MKKIDLEERYQRDIFGLGEIYEIRSVEKLKKRLFRKYHSGTLCLASNQQHGSRGISLDQLDSYLTSQNRAVLEKGFVDSPPWKSAPLEKEAKKHYNKLIITLAKIVFYFLIKLEFLWNGKSRSHMVYCLIKK